MMDARRETASKIYVKVRADHDFDGKTRPLMLRTEDGAPLRIDRVLDVRPAPSLKAGGQGIRYTCRAEGRVFLLFFDDPYWFIEAP